MKSYSNDAVSKRDLSALDEVDRKQGEDIDKLKVYVGVLAASQLVTIVVILALHFLT